MAYPHDSLTTWNAQKLAPLRSRYLVQFFSEKNSIRHWQTPPTICLTTPSDGVSLTLCHSPTKNIPVDRHQLELQDSTIPGPQRRICYVFRHSSLPPPTPNAPFTKILWPTTCGTYTNTQPFKFRKFQTTPPQKKYRWKRVHLYQKKKETVVHQRQFFFSKSRNPTLQVFYHTPSGRREEFKHVYPTRCVGVSWACCLPLSNNLRGSAHKQIKSRRIVRWRRGSTPQAPRGKRRICRKRKDGVEEVEKTGVVNKHIFWRSSGGNTLEGQVVVVWFIVIQKFLWSKY
jgi:hypothetical protein